MEVIWVLLNIAFLFLVLVLLRLMYIKGFKAGARRILGEWKHSLNEEGFTNGLDGEEGKGDV